MEQGSRPPVAASPSTPSRRTPSHPSDPGSVRPAAALLGDGAGGEDPPTFHVHDNGSVTVDAWTPEVAFTLDFLAESHPEFLISDGRTIQIRARNGWAIYEVTGISQGVVHGSLREWEGPVA